LLVGTKDFLFSFFGVILDSDKATRPTSLALLLCC
jgi:hypothetical protein